MVFARFLAAKKKREMECPPWRMEKFGRLCPCAKRLHNWGEKSNATVNNNNRSKLGPLPNEERQLDDDDGGATHRR